MQQVVDADPSEQSARRRLIGRISADEPYPIETRIAAARSRIASHDSVFTSVGRCTLI